MEFLVYWTNKDIDAELKKLSKAEAALMLVLGYGGNLVTNVLFGKSSHWGTLESLRETAKDPRWKATNTE